MSFAIAAAPPTSAAPPANTPENRKLTTAAQQFEGMLLQEMLKPMREHGFCQGDEDDKQEGSGFGDTLSSYGTEAMATAISKSGGLGIAKRVIEQVQGEKQSHAGQMAQTV
jgi:Rod binding domain-containing protein